MTLWNKASAPLAVKSWTDDRVRCVQAGIGEEVQFATKPVLARMMLARALEAGVPVSWVTADEAYGMDYKFRRFLEEHHLSYAQWGGDRLDLYAGH